MNSLVIIALNNWLLPDCSLAKCHKCYYSCWNWLNIWRRTSDSRKRERGS